MTRTPQPMMYQAIKKHAPVLEKYAQSLISEGTVSEEKYKVGYGGDPPGMHVLVFRYY